MPRKDIHETTERVVFNGVPYRRYPNSPRPEMRRYFIASGGQRLHRAIWEFHNGPIPKGHHIHHKDENTLNNDISNLECLSNGDHRRTHWSEERAEQMREIAAKARPLTKAWHASEAGHEWHKKNGQAAWDAKPARTYTCVICGKSFEAKAFRKVVRFCGNNCKMTAYRRSKQDAMERNCVRCGKTFTTYPYQPRDHCSGSCATKTAWERRKAQTPST